MKVTQIHNLKEQVIPKLNGVYANCFSHLELQVNGFNLYSKSALHSACGSSAINVTRLSQIHNLKGQEITHLNGFYSNFCSHLGQVNGFHS